MRARLGRALPSRRCARNNVGAAMCPTLGPAFFGPDGKPARLPRLELSGPGAVVPLTPWAYRPGAKGQQKRLGLPWVQQGGRWQLLPWGLVPGRHKRSVRDALVQDIKPKQLLEWVNTHAPVELRQLVKEMHEAGDL
jgi:hypothetical protein